MMSNSIIDQVSSNSLLRENTCDKKTWINNKPVHLSNDQQSSTIHVDLQSFEHVSVHERLINVLCRRIHEPLLFIQREKPGEYSSSWQPSGSYRRLEQTHEVDKSTSMTGQLHE
jgi:hypothetical protein